MRITLAISLRFMLSRRSEGSVSIITWIALFGVILGVAALVVAMAIMNGYQANLMRAMAGSLPHISVHPLKKSGFESREKMILKMKETLHPRSIFPFAMMEGLVRAKEGAEVTVHGVLLRGIIPESNREEENFLALLDDGSPDWDKLSPDERRNKAQELLMGLSERGLNPASGEIPVLLSKMLARKMGVWLGDRLTPMEFPEPGAGFSPRPVNQQLIIRGFFETGIIIFDELVIILNLEALPAVLPGKKVEISLGMRLDDPMDASKATEILRADSWQNESAYYVYSWLESNKNLFQVIKMQKVMLFLVLMLIVVIAFFGMISALTMLVVEKTKEIAILKSMGIREKGILAVFRLQGLMIGILGTVLGLGLGLLVCGFLAYVPIISIPPGVYPGTDRVPVLVAPPDILYIVTGTMLVCLAATYFSARKAKDLLPAEGLRHG